MTSPTVLADRDGNEFEFRAIDCPICKTRDFAVLGLRGGEHHRYGNGVATRIVRCRLCSLVYCDPFPFPLKSQELYGDPAKYFGGGSDTSKISAYAGVITEIRNRLPNRTPSLLDIGSGRGEALRAAARLGMTDAVGLEFSEAMIDQARELYGVKVLRESAEEHAERSGRAYDAVMLSAVLEHVHDPDSMIEAVARLTAPGAVLYVDVPNEPNLMTVVGNRVNRLRRSPVVLNLAPTFPPYHVFGFNPHALGVLLEKHSFRIETCKVWAHPHVPAQGTVADKLKSLVATQVNRIANLTGSAHNMSVWARRL